MRRLFLSGCLMTMAFSLRAAEIDDLAEVDTSAGNTFWTTSGHANTVVSRESETLPSVFLRAGAAEPSPSVAQLDFRLMTWYEVILNAVSTGRTGFVIVFR